MSVSPRIQFRASVHSSLRSMLISFFPNTQSAWKKVRLPFGKRFGERLTVWIFASVAGSSRSMDSGFVNVLKFGDSLKGCHSLGIDDLS